MDSPQHILIKTIDNELHIRFRWFSQRYTLPAAVFALLLPTLLPLFIKEVIHYKAWFILVILLPALTYVVYMLLTKLLNSSYMRLTPKALYIEHGPLPLKKASCFNTQNLHPLQVESKQYAGKSRRTYYEIVSINDKIGKKTILSDIDQYEQARFIADKLIEYIASLNSDPG